MPRPMPADFKFYIERKYLGTHYEMPFMEAASNYYEIGYTVTGVNLSITPTYSCISHSGDVRLLPPYIYHKNIVLTDEPYDRFLIKFTPEFVQPFIDTVGKHTFDTIYSKRVYKFNADIKKQLYTQFQRMLDVFSSDAGYRNFQLQCMFYDLLLTVYGKNIPDNEEILHPTPLTPPIIDALHYMEKNYNKNPSLEDTARASGYSPSYFSRLFQSQLGKSYSEYLIDIRIRFVQYLLLNTQKSITEIALETGYGHASNLSEQFKKITGMTPLQYRKHS